MGSHSDQTRSKYDLRVPMSRSFLTRRTTCFFVPIDRPRHMGGREGRLFNHNQLLLGTCGRRKPMDAICSSASTTLRPVSSVYSTADVALAHTPTTLTPFGTRSQGTCGDVVMTTSGLAALKRVEMNGTIGCHRDVVEPKSVTTARRASFIL